MRIVKGCGALSLPVMLLRYFTHRVYCPGARLENMVVVDVPFSIQLSLNPSIVIGIVASVQIVDDNKRQSEEILTVIQFQNFVLLFVFVQKLIDIILFAEDE